MIHHAYLKHGLFETFSAADITKCGSYAYINDPSFEPLLLSWSIDGGEVETIDFTAEGLGPAYKLIKYLENPEYLKTAYNVAFEHEVFRRIFGIDFPIEQWQDTMILAAYAGLPRRLAEVGKALGLPEDKQKMKEGAALIRYFCIPFKGKRRMPSDSPERWQTFVEYNRQDVVTEMTIRNLLLEGFPLPKREQKLWVMDQKINDFGVGIDLPFVEAAIDLANKEKDRLTAEAIQISGLENPNSVSQLKQWLGLDEGATLRKADVADMLQTVTDETKKRVLQIRQQLGKSSVSKFDAMARSACPDGRVRGSLAFYGANRSGRWAGRLIQPQNFRQNHIGDGSLEDLAYARKLVEQRDAESIRHFFGDVSDTLSQLTRTALRPRQGHMFAVADFSAIEARVIAWLADEKWRMDTFLKGGDIYCASASQMFHVPVVKNGVNGELRQKGKIAELALGYGGSVGALTNMGALNMGLKEDELPEIVEKWREASPRIVALWYRMNDAMLNAINDGETTGIAKGVAIIPEVRSGIPVMAMKLPSGRSLYYVRPAIGVNRFGGASITYEGYEIGKWGRVETFGGKGVENCIQAIARDCLARAMYKVMEKYQIVFHVHDEMIVEVPENQADKALEDMLDIMAEPIPWAPGLVLKGAGYTCPYYYKD